MVIGAAVDVSAAALTRAMRGQQSHFVRAWDSREGEEKAMPFLDVHDEVQMAQLVRLYFAAHPRELARLEQWSQLPRLTQRSHPDVSDGSAIDIAQFASVARWARRQWLISREAAAHLIRIAQEWRAASPEDRRTLYRRAYDRADKQRRRSHACHRKT